MLRAMPRSVVTALTAVLLCSLGPAMAFAGDFLSHPAPFELESDTVHWSIVIARGNDCIQGLRGGRMVFESAALVEPAKTGKVVVQGPSFHYYAGDAAGTDSFGLTVVGTAMRMRGTSTVKVDVEVR
jgi:hypothetical protein